jgi:hypothetical protein
VAGWPLVMFVERKSVWDRDIMFSGAGVEGITLREPARVVDGMQVAEWSGLEMVACAEEQ